MDAVTTVDVLTTRNNDVKLIETLLLHDQKSSSCFERINKLDRDTSRVRKFYHAFPKMSRDIIFIPSILKGVQRWRASWIRSIEKKRSINAAFSGSGLRLFIVHVRSARSSALGCHLAWVSKLLRGRGRFGRFFSPPAPSVHLKIKIPVTVRRGISKRSHEKIGDCEQSTVDYN